jgi:hypothetical protein
LKSKQTPTIGHDFARALNENEVIKEIIRTGNFSFTLDSKFILTIYRIKQEEPVVEEPAAV